MTRQTRVPPSEPEDLRKYLRMLQEDAEDDRTRLDSRAPFKKPLEFVSLGVDEEIRVEHELPYTPENLEVVRRKGEYLVWESRENLADTEFIYVSTSAPDGSIFRVLVW